MTAHFGSRLQRWGRTGRVMLDTEDLFAAADVYVDNTPRGTIYRDQRLRWWSWCDHHTRIEPDPDAAVMTVLRIAAVRVWLAERVHVWATASHWPDDHRHVAYDARTPGRGIAFTSHTRAVTYATRRAREQAGT